MVPFQMVLDIASWLTKLKIFTTWPFKKKFADL